jgi:hypothetical protein
MDLTKPRTTLRGIWTAVLILVFTINSGGVHSLQVDVALAPVGVSREDVLTPILTTLAIDRYPVVGQAAALTCELSTAMDAPGTSAQFELPADARLVSGSLTWQGDLFASQPVQLVAAVIFTAPGEKSVFCQALRPIDANNTWGHLSELYLTVGHSSGQAGFSPILPLQHAHLAGQARVGEGLAVQNNLPARYNPSFGQGVESPLPLDASLAASRSSSILETPPGSLTITGRWQYYDRSDQLASAELLVEAVKGDDGSHLAWCYTDITGGYRCGPFTNPGAAGVRMAWYSYITYDPYDDVLATVNPALGVTNDISNTYAVQTGAIAFEDGENDFGDWTIANGDPFERAFWVTTDLERTWRYIWFGAGIDQSPPETAGSGTVQWKIDSTDGTYYIGGGNIHLTGTDPLSNTMAIHEYGHNIMYIAWHHFLPSNDCPNPHYIQLMSNPHCGWIEGWADFLPLAVNHDPVFRWWSGASLDLETPSWGTLPYWQNDDRVEGRVAGALWDILDTADDGDDTYRDPQGIANIWDTFYHQTSATFSEFWAAWLARGHDNVSAGPIMALYQNTINYRLGSGNDDFSSSALISGIPFFVTGLDTTQATTQGLDPLTACGSMSTPRQSRSVWYSFTPPVAGDYSFAALTSNDTPVLALWTGSWGLLVSSACNDDAATGAAAHSQITTSLIGGTPYYIEALSYGNGSGGSLDLSVCKVPEPSGLISPGFNSATNEDMPSFTWNAASEADEYHFILSASSNLSSPIYNFIAATSSYTLPAAIQDGVYYWNVRGRNTSGGCNDSGNWNTTRSLVVDTVPPQTRMAELPAWVIDEEINLAWSTIDPEPGSGVANYDVQFKVGVNGVWTDWLVGTTDTAAAFGPITPIHPLHGQTYYFRVRAHDRAGNVESFTPGDGDTFSVYNTLQTFFPLVSG